jgi:hypothetical protein
LNLEAVGRVCGVLGLHLAPIDKPAKGGSEGGVMTCRHCGDALPDNAPPSITSCTAYADWRARQVGDILPEGEAAMLAVFKGLCALDVAIRDGLELLPELD